MRSSVREWRGEARARAGAGRARVRVGYITRKSIVDVVARVRSRVTRGARRDRIHGWKPRAPYLTFIPRARDRVCRFRYAGERCVFGLRRRARRCVQIRRCA